MRKKINEESSLLTPKVGYIYYGKAIKKGSNPV
jgi:hypothetical protein